MCLFYSVYYSKLTKSFLRAYHCILIDMEVKIITSELHWKIISMLQSNWKKYLINIRLLFLPLRIQSVLLLVILVFTLHSH